MNAKPRPWGELGRDGRASILHLAEYRARQAAGKVGPLSDAALLRYLGAREVVCNRPLLTDVERAVIDAALRRLDEPYEPAARLATERENIAAVVASWREDANTAAEAYERDVDEWTAKQGESIEERLARAAAIRAGEIK